MPKACPIQPLLEFQHVSHSFTSSTFWGHKTELKAVQDVSFQIYPGETLGLLGESGCGKSTLARLAVRLLQPAQGEILLYGTPYSTLSQPQESGVQMIFQDPFSSLNPRLRIASSIAEPLHLQKLTSSEKQAKVAQILELVGLRPEFGQRYPHEFSGGQRQRIAIARALITHPSLVVCDEAVSALDASVQAQVLNLLKDIQEKFNLAYLFISHNINVVGYMSQRILVMYLGRIVEEAKQVTLFSQAAHPYTQALLAASPSHKIVQLQAFLPGEIPSPFNPPSGCAFHPRCPKAMPICSEQAPPRVQLAEDHAVVCHLY